MKSSWTNQKNYFCLGQLWISHIPFHLLVWDCHASKPCLYFIYFLISFFQLITLFFIFANLCSFYFVLLSYLRCIFKRVCWTYLNVLWAFPFIQFIGSLLYLLTLTWVGEVLQYSLLWSFENKYKIVKVKETSVSNIRFSLSWSVFWSNVTLK